MSLKTDNEHFECGVGDIADVKLDGGDDEATVQFLRLVRDQRTALDVLAALLIWICAEDAVEAMNDLYRTELRVWLNLFQPSAKLLKKVRLGSKLRRYYDVPRTPLDRLATSEGNDANYLTTVNRLIDLRTQSDPFELSRQIDRKLQRIYALANARQSPRVPSRSGRRRVTF